MELYRGDILQKNGTLWISQRLLYIIGVSEGYGKYVRHAYRRTLPAGRSTGRAVMPDTGASWRYARIGGRLYYDYNRIPDRAPTYYRSRLPDIEEIQEHLATSAQAPSYLNSMISKTSLTLMEEWKRNCTTDDVHIFAKEGLLTPDRALQITRARALANIIVQQASAYRRLGLETRGQYWQAAAMAVKKAALYGLQVRTAEGLRKKLKNWPADKHEQYKRLMSGLYGNSNRKVVGKHKYVDELTGELFAFDLHQAVIFNLWMNPGHGNKLNQTGIAGIYDRYRQKVEEYGLDAVSERTVQFHVSRFSTRALTAPERHGKDYFNSTYVPYVPQFMPRHTGSIWVADFSGTKILYKDTVTRWNTRTGKKYTKQVVKSHYMCRITDTATGNLVGYSLSDTPGERWEDVVPALKMAIANNHGYAAMELITDNGGVWTKPENRSKLQMLFGRHRTIGLGNKQSNKAEHYVKLLSDMARVFDSWSTLGFLSRDIDNQGNPDYLDVSRVPDRATVEAQIARLVERFNHRRLSNGSVPAEEQQRAERLHPQLNPPDEVIKRYCLGRHTVTRLDRSRGLLKIDRNVAGSRQSRLYKIEQWHRVLVAIDEKSYGSTDLKVKVCYDDDAADIYTIDGRYVSTAPIAELSHPGLYEADAKSRKALEGYMADKEAMRRAAENFEQQVQQISASADMMKQTEIIPELSYLQRAALNGGKAKDEHLELLRQLEESDNEPDFDILNQL